MADEKKQTKAKCVKHEYMITNWMIKGGHQKATQARCRYCLIPACLEQIDIAEWKESQGMQDGLVKC